MNFIVNLKTCGNKSFLKQATQQLKKVGDTVSKKTQNGTEIKYIRGENINARGFGDKYKLYKEITKPDGTRYITNSNVIRNDVYVNEVYHIEPNYRCIPDFVPWADHRYTLDTGFSNTFKVSSSKTDSMARMGTPKMLLDLLRKKVAPRNGYRTNQQQTHYSSAHKSGGSTQSTGKITKEAFISHMESRLSKNDSKSPANIKDFKDSEVRNLAKLFGVVEESIRNFSKNLQRELILKFHPDKNPDKNAPRIFQIVSSIAPVK